MLQNFGVILKKSDIENVQYFVNFLDFSVSLQKA